MSPIDLSKTLELYRTCSEYADSCDIIELVTYSDSSKKPMEVRSYLETTFRRNCLYQAKSSKWLLREEEWKEVERLELSYDWKAVKVTRSFWGIACKPKKFEINDALYSLNTCSLGAVSLLHGLLLGDLGEIQFGQEVRCWQNMTIDPNGNNTLLSTDVAKLLKIIVDPISKHCKQISIENIRNTIDSAEMHEYRQKQTSLPSKPEIQSITTEILVKSISFS
jgi:hypothetical protein